MKMQIVINIDDEDYDDITLTGENTINLGVLLDLREAVRNGTPLPSGHGKLGDLDKVADRLEVLRDGWNRYGNEYESGKYDGYDCALDEVMDAPTIIEADRSEEDG
jgi:hypothetical protein